MAAQLQDYLFGIAVAVSMGTVICHPSTDIAAQCTACLPKSLNRKRGRLEGIWRFPITNSQSDDSVYKLADKRSSLEQLNLVEIKHEDFTTSNNITKDNYDNNVIE
ncbi:CLUMA_CG013911, isoform A [Clunio marinus]|uniref:CLUMA_CG013911, isoform A n=1 Tax=Clunio marinus TaxID=568069 RepID=A0A1J1IK92_9DIPT|nr:CLUMA_CG013911, isoform A [Clunio marinus]